MPPQTVQLWNTKYTLDMPVSLFSPVTMEDYLLYDVTIPFSPILNAKPVKATQVTTARVEQRSCSLLRRYAAAQMP